MHKAMNMFDIRYTNCYNLDTEQCYDKVSSTKHFIYTTVIQ